MELILHYGNGKTARVVAKPTQDRHLLITNGNGIRFELSGALPQVLDHWLRELEPSGLLQSEIEVERFSFITIEDLTDKSEAEQLALLIQRFDGPDTIELCNALKDDYKRVTKREYKPDEPVQGVDQLSLDLEMIKDIAGELLDVDGAPVWGAQTRIADELGIANGGVTNRKRILDVIEALQRRAVAA